MHPRPHILPVFLSLIMISGLSWQCKTMIKPDIAEIIPEIEVIQPRIPMFAGTWNEGMVTVQLEVPENGALPVLKRVSLDFSEKSDLSGIDSVRVRWTDGDQVGHLGLVSAVSTHLEVPAEVVLEPGALRLSVDFFLKPEAGLMTRFGLDGLELSFRNYKTWKFTPEEHYVTRTALRLRAAGQDNCDTYRIPGLVTTGKGTLIAVYDNRYNNSKDLQEDIDVGMSRSTDGGQSWEPMRVIMDLGEWGGRPQRLNGVGDPAVLYDHTTGTIWVAALWISGFNEKDMLWWASKPGMKPNETGQFRLVKSTDDGLTWSDPINITEQIKDPAWQLLFQGPGAGITLADGTLVFAAQFKTDTGSKALDGGQYTCHSTIVYSQDGGQSWHIGTGAKPNTTEAQVVQLSDGGLMLNMRDDLNRRAKDDTNGRAVSVTHDLGQTWTMHPTSNSALQEPNCMASIIGADLTVNGKTQRVLFFSNPNNKNERTNMTIKASLDNGNTWPETLQVELNALAGYGYSCLTMVDENHLGILYEGVKELYFQKVPVAEVLNLGGFR